MKRFHRPLFRSNPTTNLLHAAGRGDPQAAAELLPLVYDELRRLAAARMAQLGPGQTLQPTATGVTIETAPVRKGDIGISSTP